MWNKNVDELYMKTKCPKQPSHFLKKEDHQFVPCLEIKPHPKNAWQSLEIPLTHPKSISQSTHWPNYEILWGIPKVVWEINHCITSQDYFKVDGLVI